MTLLLTLMVAGPDAEVVFSGTFVRDPLADALKVTIYILAGIAFLYAKDYLRERGLFKGEYYVLGLFAVLGMMIMVSANGFLTVYLGLELLALSLYALVAFDRDSDLASEAAMKYFVLGALASGMLLYGISMIYGATGSIEFQAVAEALPRPEWKTRSWSSAWSSWLSGWHSSSAPSLFTCGCRMYTTVLPPR